MSQLEFDEALGAQMDAFYRRRDVRRRRRLVLEALDPQPGDRVVDVGCGPGFYLEEVLGRVGEQGAVTGVDPSPAMRALAARRVEGASNAEVVAGDATALPLPDACADRALSVQVLEYVADTAAACAELARVLRPGGRLVVWDIDWSTLAWHTCDAARMARMSAAWDRHLAHPSLPRTLAPALRAAGFADVRCEAHGFVTLAMDPETFGGGLLVLIEQYLRGLDDVSGEDVDEWIAEQRALDRAGAFFFAVTQFCFTAERSR